MPLSVHPTRVLVLAGMLVAAPLAAQQRAGQPSGQQPAQATDQPAAAGENPFGPSVAVQQDSRTAKGVDPFSPSEVSDRPAGQAATPDTVSVPPTDVPAHQGAHEKQPCTRDGLGIVNVDSPAYARIRLGLQQPVTCEFVETPLADVVAFLRQAARLPIVIDARSLDDVGLGTDTPVTISLQEIPLRSALRIMLRELDLTFVVRDEVVLITTPESAENRLQTLVYPVAELAEDTSEPLLADQASERFELLQDIVTHLIAPDAWSEVGGAGVIAPYDDANVVVISQTEEVHEQIGALLAALAAARQADPKAHPDDAAFLVSSGADAEARARVESALSAAADLEFVDVPLQEVTDFISDQYRIPVLIHGRALDDIGVGSDTPVTVSLSGITLRSALRLMLDQLDLTFLVRDGVLLITTPEEAENRLTTYVYVVGDLPSATSGDASRESSLQELAHMIQTAIDRDSWEDVGGPGVIEVVAPWGLLVVSQSADRHQRIAGLLSATRQARAAHPPADMATAANEAAEPILELRMYMLSGTAPMSDVKELIQATVDPSSWVRSDLIHADVFPLGNRFLVRQTAANHRQIQQLLRTTGAASPWPRWNRNPEVNYGAPVQGGCF